MRTLRRLLLAFACVCALSTSAFAATTKWIESGTDATQGLEFYGTTAGTGTIASDATVSHTGARSLKVQNGAASTTSVFSASGILSDAGSRCTFWVNFGATLPSTGANPFFRPTTSGGTSIFSIQLTTAAHLNIRTGVSDTTGATTLSASTWYRVTVSYTITNTTTHHVRIFLNGVQEADETNTGTIGGPVTDRFKFESDLDGSSHVFTMNFDDVYCDNGSDLGDPGNISVTAKRPVSNGTLNDFVTQVGAGGSGYGSGHSPQVNEQPLSTTNGWSGGQAASAKVEEYTIEGQTVGDVNVTGDTFVDFLGWVYAKIDSAATGNIVLKNVTANISLTTSYALFTAIAGSAVYPAGNTDIGITNASNNHLYSLAECGVLVAYIPVVASGPPIGSLATMGVGR